MNVQDQIKQYIASQPEAKQSEMQALHRRRHHGNSHARRHQIQRGHDLRCLMGDVRIEASGDARRDD